MPKPIWKFVAPAAALLVLTPSLLAAPAEASAAPATLPPGTSNIISTWEPRLHARYDAFQRQCSAPKAANSVVSGQQVTLVVKRQTDRAEIAAARSAGCSRSLLKKGRVYSNAMVSTENQITGMMRAGKVIPTVVETRVKFPNAKGLLGGVWIQSEEGRGPEIDLIESYGTRVTHVHHKFGPLDNRGYKSIKRSASWYKKEHTFKVAFTTSTIVYSIDGVVTNTVLNAALPAATQYFVVASLLSSDPDLRKINNKKLSSSKMIVRWVKITQGA